MTPPEEKGKKRLALQEAGTGPRKKPRLGGALRGMDSSKVIPLLKHVKISLPLLAIILCVGYFGLIVRDMYISTAQFAIRGSRSAPTEGLLAMMTNFTSNETSSSHIVSSYITSPDMFFALNEKLGLRDHYYSNMNFMKRMLYDDTVEDYTELWKSVVGVHFDSSTSISKLTVKAYTPVMAYDVCSEIMDRSEVLLNKLNERALEDTLLRAKMEVWSSEERLAMARAALNKFRNQNQEFNPEATVSSRLELVGKLEAQVAAIQAEIEAKLKFMKEDSHQIRALKNTLAGLEEQITFEKSRLSDYDNSKLIKVIEEYEALAMEEEFAKEQYASAMASLETARIQMEGKSSYIVAFQQPTMPDEVIYPERGKLILISVLAILLAEGLILLIIAAVRDHIGV